MSATDDTITFETRPPFGTKSFGLSDKGQRRDSNEDCFAIAEVARTIQIHHTNLP